MKIFQKRFHSDYVTIFYNEKKKEISCDCLAGHAPKGIKPYERTPEGLPRHSEKYCYHAKDFKKELNSGIKTWNDVTPKHF